MALTTEAYEALQAIVGERNVTRDPAILDAWGHPIVLQVHGLADGTDDSRLVSAGPDGELETDRTADSSTLSHSASDDIVVFLTHVDDRQP